MKDLGPVETGAEPKPARVVEILLVEDNPSDVELTLRALKEHRMANHVRVARDGAEALDLLLGEDRPASEEAQPPRLVLLDLKLPRVSGLEVLERMKGDRRTRRIPVVILTSSREDPDIQAAYDLGANGYVVKPVAFSDFVQAVRDLSLYWLILNQPPGP